MDNLEKLISGIYYDLDTSLKLPRFNPARPAVEELRERAELGLAQKGLTSKEYQDRLDQELAVIHDMGFDDYFLVVWDCCVSDVRMATIWEWDGGSAVGSLVSYALDITGIDPVDKNLIFERSSIVNAIPCLILILTFQTFIDQSSFVMFVIGMAVNTWRRLSLIRPLEQNRQFVMFSNAMVFQSTN